MTNTYRNYGNDRSSPTDAALARQPWVRGAIAGLIAYGFLLVIWCAIVTYAHLLVWPWWVPLAAAAVYLAAALPAVRSHSLRPSRRVGRQEAASEKPA